MKKALLLLTSLFVGVLLFILAFQEVGMAEIKSAFFLFPEEAILLIFLVNFLAVFAVGSYRWQVILKAQGCDAGFWTVVRIKLAGFAMSYITPSAFLFSEPIRAYMIKEEKKYSWEKSFASVIVDQGILFVALFCLMATGFVYLAGRFSLTPAIFWGFAVLAVFSIGAFYLFYKRIVRKGEGEEGFFTYLIGKMRLDKVGFIKSNMQGIANTESVMETFFREEKKNSALVIMLGFLEAFLDASVVFFACYYLGHTLDVLESIGIFAFLTFASMIPIPGALGSFEVIMTFIFDQFGFGKENGLAFSLIYRLTNISFCVIGLGALIHFSVKTAKDKYSNEAPPALIKVHDFFRKRTFR